MKKLLLGVIAVFLVSAGSAFAQELSIDVSGLYALEPSEEEVGAGFGGGLGLNYGLPVENLAARIEASYLKFSKDDVELTLIPVMLGLKYSIHVEPLSVFGVAGGEMSFDKSEITGDSATVLKALGAETEESETNFGGAVGAGVEVPVAEAVFVGASAMYHILDSSYFSFGIFLGYEIPM